MKTVYFDVENTLEVPFITGIQRVTREFSKTVLGSRQISDNLEFKPVVYDYRKARWRTLRPRELSSLLSGTPRSTSLSARILNKIRPYIPVSPSKYITRFEAGSVFLDIDSSWHSKLKRSELLPLLKNQEVKIVKLHYDIIPLLFSGTSHPNTVKVFTDHFLSHLEYTDLFVCISNRTREDLVSYCEQKSRPRPSSQVIVLGDDSTSADKIPSHQLQLETLDKLGIDPQTPYIISVGTIEPRKNYLLLLKAFEGLISTTTLNLVIVGKIGWRSEEILSAFENHEFYQTRILHLQDISDPQLDVLYRNAWLNVVASHYEGFGLPVVESLSRGCATICSNSGSLKEIGGKHVRFFSADSIDQLAALVEELYSSPEKHNELRRRAYNRDTTSWTECAKNFIGCIEKLVEES